MHIASEMMLLLAHNHANQLLVDDFTHLGAFDRSYSGRYSNVLPRPIHLHLLRPALFSTS